MHGPGSWSPFLVTEDRLQCHACPCGIWGKQSSTGACFSPSTVQSRSSDIPLSQVPCRQNAVLRLFWKDHYTRYSAQGVVKFQDVII